MANTKLQKMLAKREAITASIRKEQNKLDVSKRKMDTRRKVLAGAAVLEWAKRDSDFAAKLTAELKAFLTKDNDRVLFDLPLLGNRHGDARTPHRAA